MNLEINTTVTYQNQNDSPSRTTIHYGGTRSGKSYALLQWIIVKCLEGKEDVVIVRKTIPSLKRTIVKDFEDIMGSLELWNSNDFNQTDRIYQFYTGSTISFISTDNPEKLRGLKSSILWLEEANEIDEESWFQLRIRCTGPIILSLNPTISPHHWIRGIDDATQYFTTFKNNPYLEKEVVSAIKALERTNPKAWRTYGLGEFVQNDKAVFTFNVIDWVPDDAEFVCIGMDFGYSNDPTAIVSLFRKDREIYLVENCYERGLVTNDIAAKLRTIVGDNRWEIWADSAEPRLIEELYRLGFNIRPVVKGKDSINFGIQVLQNYSINIPKTCQNIVNEFYGYEWETDRFGKQLDRPIDFNNHCIDAARYAAMMRLSQVATAKGKYVIRVR
jgi:phage terminase large subunit